jgi:uncharacterized protein (TIGR00255 family)
MTIRSMTGFARQEGHRNACSWHWEMRTVNGRGFDVRLRLPQGFEEIEQPARDMCKKRLSRGNCTATLTFSRENREGVARLNEDVFRQVLVAAERARELANTEPARLDGLLSMRGVIEYADEAEDEAEINARRDAILADFGKLLDGVVSARTAEGAHLAQEVGALVDETEHLIGQIESSPARTAQAISARLREQVKRLLGETAQFDEQRIHQEAVLLAAKADVEEELARLRAHIVAARDLLKSEDPVGRKFEFLTQEFNREANTICSKSNDTDITQAGLSLKAVIDRMREQVQNIE